MDDDDDDDLYEERVFKKVNENVAADHASVVAQEKRK
jgi:hypothetical protein